MALEEDGTAYARDCVRLAGLAQTPELREQLLQMAREWMTCAMKESRWPARLADGRRIVARQRGIVDRFEAAGLDATSAQEALAAFQQSQAILEYDLAALLKRNTS